MLTPLQRLNGVRSKAEFLCTRADPDTKELAEQVIVLAELLEPLLRKAQME